MATQAFLISYLLSVNLYEHVFFRNSTAAHVAMRKIAISLADSHDLRVILSVLYTITEVIRNEKALECSEYEADIKSFCSEIGELPLKKSFICIVHEH